jgi:hypothetical protein
LSGRRTYVVSETETTSGLLSDSELVTGDHLDLDSEELGVVDGLLGVLTRGVEDGEKADELKAVTLSVLVVGGDVLEGDGERTKSSESKLFDVLLELVLNLGALVAGAELDDGSSHSLGDTLHGASGVLGVGDLGTLVGRVKGLEVKELDASAGGGWVGDGVNDAPGDAQSSVSSLRGRVRWDVHVDGILVLDSRGVGSKEHDFGGRVRSVGLEGRLVDGKLVGGKLNAEMGVSRYRERRRTTLLTVPVLSEQRMVTPASSSMAVILVTMALYLASCWAPTARVTERTVGMAMGIPPIKRTRMLLSPRRYD